MVPSAVADAAQPQMLEKWQRYAWNFFEAPANAEGLHQARRHAVKRETLIQERPEGGQHCQDIEIFTRSLYQRQVSRLVTPSSHKGVNIVASYVNRAYGHLRMGRRLFHSSWSTWSAVINLTSRAGELRSAPSGPDDRDRATG